MKKSRFIQRNKKNVLRKDILRILVAITQRFHVIFCFFFLSKLSTIYILTNRTIIYMYIYIYIYIIHTCIHTSYTYTCICTFTHIYTHTYTHIGKRLDKTKTAPYSFFINSKAKKLTKIHWKRKLTIKACLPTTILLTYQL